MVRLLRAHGGEGCSSVPRTTDSDLKVRTWVSEDGPRPRLRPPRGAIPSYGHGHWDAERLRASLPVTHWLWVVGLSMTLGQENVEAQGRLRTRFQKRICLCDKLEEWPSCWKTTMFWEQWKILYRLFRAVVTWSSYLGYFGKTGVVFSFGQGRELRYWGLAWFVQGHLYGHWEWPDLGLLASLHIPVLQEDLSK